MVGSLLMGRLKAKFPKLFKKTNEDIIKDMLKAVRGVVDEELTLVDYSEDDQKIIGTLRIRKETPLNNTLVDDLCDLILDNTSLKGVEIRVANKNDDIKQIVMLAGGRDFRC